MTQNVGNCTKIDKNDPHDSTGILTRLLRCKNKNKQNKIRKHHPWLKIFKHLQKRSPLTA